MYFLYILFQHAVASRWEIWCQFYWCYFLVSNLIFLSKTYKILFLAFRNFYQNMWGLTFLINLTENSAHPFNRMRSFQKIFFYMFNYYFIFICSFFPSVNPISYRLGLLVLSSHSSPPSHPTPAYDLHLLVFFLCALILKPPMWVSIVTVNAFNYIYWID